MIHPDIQSRMADLVRLCIEHQVIRLHVFGSGATGEFDSGGSDLDFLVEFRPLDPERHTEAYFGLLGELGELFSCDIDLVEMAGVRNRFVRESIEKHKVELYAAA